MNIRKYSASSVEAALSRVRRELGADAVILESREIAGAPAAARFEVLAARDANPAPVRPPAAPRPAPFAPAPPSAAFDARFSTEAERLHRRLLDRDVDSRLARELVLAVGRGERPGEAALLDALKRLLPAAAPGPGIQVLVGPTGAGKTTTLAKLAAREEARTGRAPGLLTCDTFRVAAVEQLAVFADLLEAPLEVAYTPQEMGAAAADFLAQGRTVLVDTPGRAPRDGAGLEKLAGLLAALPARCTHLVVPAPLKARDIPALLEAWGPLRPDRLLLSKLDETDAPGALLTLLVRARLPVSWVTFGQEVPDDLAPASSADLARAILQGDSHVGSGQKTA